MNKFLGVLLSLGLGLGFCVFAIPAMANCSATANAPALTPGIQPCSMDLSGNLRVSTTGGAGSNGSITAAGTNGTLAQAVQGITGGVPLPASPTASITGGTSTTVGIVTTATTNPLLIKNSQSTLYGVMCYNTGVTAIYVKIYAQGSTPVPGTNTPQEVIGLNPTSQTSINYPAVGVNFPSGLGMAITANPALLDNTAVTAGAGFCNVFYK